MVTGSLGSTLYGEPRATNDIDVVIDPAHDQLRVFLEQANQNEFRVAPEVALQAFRRRSMFNIIDQVTGEKADLIFRKDRPFSRTEFSRRQEVPVGDETIFVVSPEDSLLSKLEWAKKAESERQFRDALGIAMARKESLDRDYLEHWAAELDLTESLHKLLREAGPFPGDNSE
jgi:hypothetical protein